MNKRDFLLKPKEFYIASLLLAYAICTKSATRKEHTVNYYNLKQCAIIAAHNYIISSEQFQVITISAYNARKGIVI